ncbi:MAG: class I lanthipeptide [Candidatus Aminicenantes bacterium]|nr:class I lanthipeptide [Candidatus Aminicenantes bacterium]
MKQKRFDKKLSLNKKTLVNLSGSEMDNARGGVDFTTPTYCDCGTRFSCFQPDSVCICQIVTLDNC